MGIQVHVRAGIILPEEKYRNCSGSASLRKKGQPWKYRLSEPARTGEPQSKDMEDLKDDS